MNDRVSPHILRRVLVDGETVATTTADGPRALLVFRDVLAAANIADHWEWGAEHEPTAVSPEEIEEVCANHGLGLVCLYGFSEPEALDVVHVETVSELFEEA